MMELVLNTAWLLMCVALFALWMRQARNAPAKPGARQRSLQLLALAIALLIFFPIISVSDDLLIAQGPAEADICLTKSCNCGHHLHHHQPMPIQAALPQQSYLQIAGEYSTLVLKSELLDRSTQNPALRRVVNRPPPAIA
jgi:hypothetical protein